jgi:hypothetical protein
VIGLARGQRVVDLELVDVLQDRCDALRVGGVERVLHTSRRVVELRDSFTAGDNRKHGQQQSAGRSTTIHGPERYHKAA